MRGIYGEIQAQLMDRERHRNNAGRRAWQSVTFETVGSGELLPADPIMFDTPFFEEPYVTYGHVLVDVPDREVFFLPASTAGVFKWVRNKRQWWTGAYVYFRVYADVKPGVSASTPAEPKIHHHFTFSANSYKVLSGEINSELQELRPTLTPPGA